jgi:hypothetical protein
MFMLRLRTLIVCCSFVQAAGAVPQIGGAHIVGRVTAAETGQPVSGAQVQAVDSSVSPAVTKHATSGADGTYDLTGLPAGVYSVSATQPGFVQTSYGVRRAGDIGRHVTLGANDTVRSIDIALRHGGTITGVVTDPSGAPMSAVALMPFHRLIESGEIRFSVVSVQIRAVTDAHGAFSFADLPEGAYYLAATGNRPVMPDGTPNRFGYATTMYPGTASHADAKPITVTAGQTTRVTMAMVPGKLSGVSGGVIGQDGQPRPSGTVSVRSMDGLSGIDAKGVLIRPGGAWVMLGLPPGHYVAQTQDPVEAPGTPPSGSSAEFTIGADNVTGVVLKPIRWIAGSGRVVVDPADAAAFDPSAVQIGTTQVASEGMRGPQPLGRVQSDLTFTFHTFASRSLLRVYCSAPGWFVRAVKKDGVDVTDTGVEYREAQDVTGLEVVLTRHPARVSGVVTIGSGVVTGDATVAFFSKDSAKGRMLLDRHFAIARPDQVNAFLVSTLPAGDYFAIAVDYLDRYEWTDPKTIDRLRACATPVTLKDGETVSVKLALVK